MTRERFESVEVTEGGRPRALVEGTRVVVTVTDGTHVSASAGCNAMGVQDGIVDGRLSGTVVTTLKSCGPERDAQDVWLGGFLGSGPAWERDGDDLRLVSGETAVVLVLSATNDR